MAHIIKIELGLFLAILFGVLTVIGLTVYGLSAYYAGGIARVLGLVLCKTPMLPKHIGFTPFAPQGNEVPLGGGSGSVMTEFAINGTYYITSEYYLRPSTYVCIAPITTGDSLLFGAMNRDFIPKDNYGYITCVTGNGPTWLNTTLGPGAYALVAAIYGTNSSGTAINITILRPVTGTLLNNLAYYPQCGYPTLGEVPPHTTEEKPLFFHNS
ncbi:hypothetical protein GCM10007981_00010 [Thermocladium modestius]|uniref:Uncharacterized protein n=1 Tax=Thermocladium modestius TaxID=62609 RepID=A0A830GR72_9CREN|nr:hypothetical protein [Thermocladium modestius]GGP18820.1 hypothetical protein GCM10007981_00010 [Thermocladium modestius]